MLCCSLVSLSGISNAAVTFPCTSLIFSANQQVLSGPVVVSMRPIPAALVPKAVLCTGRFPAVHGAPLHIGDPAGIGIKAINKPDFGDAVEIKPGEVPVFWACGVTPQAVIMAAKPDFAITHAPGHMFIADLRDSDYAVF